MYYRYMPKIPESIYGYPVRAPYPGEDTFFKGRPEVGGMAAEDGKITLNPYSKLSDDEKSSVAKNEAIRLWMRDKKPNLSFPVSPKQKQAFANTEYGGDENALKQTIVARILSGDPSALAEKGQIEVANSIMRQIEGGQKSKVSPRYNSLAMRKALMRQAASRLGRK